MEATLHNVASSSMTHDAYTIGWICALPKELTAARAMLDEMHPDLPQPPADPNTYCLGRIGEHDVVIVSLPKGEIGNNCSASVATRLLATFPQVRFGLMVGIGGGVPSEENDIRLGDVVVSSPVGTHGGVVQWDFGKAAKGGRFERTGALNTSPRLLRTAVAKLESTHQMSDSRVPEYITDMLRKYPKLRKFADRASLDDVLFNANYHHFDDGDVDCSRCDSTTVVNRPPREEDFVVHYGAIASGNKVVKDGTMRDQISRDLGGVLCFEMEAAGLMNEFPCLVIRGICDYADSHKNKKWQEYAAVTAAAFAKELINFIPQSQVANAETANATMNELLGEAVQTAQRIEGIVLDAEEERILNWLSPIKVSPMYLDARSRRSPGTGDWLLASDEFIRWKSSAGQLLWLFGVGERFRYMSLLIENNADPILTVINSSRVIENLEVPQQNDHHTKLAYWYFRFDDAVTLSVSNMVRSFIRQLTPFPLPTSVRKLWDQHRSRSMEPDDRMLTELLDTIIGGLGEVYIIIDALDECPQYMNRRQERESLFGYIKCLMQQHNESIRILVTSRPEPDIHDALVAYTGFDIEVNMKRDVQKFVENTLQANRWLSGWTDAIKMEIREKLLSITDSRFLWTDLQLERLKECHTHDQIRDYLRTMPQSLEDTYQKTLKRIPSKDISIAHRILIWLTASLRPLTLKEVAAAVDLVQPESVLRICTSTLVTLVYEGSTDQMDATHQIVKLAHFSVREFLVSGDGRGRCDEEYPWYHFSNASAHAAIAKQTLDSLLKTQDEDITEETLSTKPIIQYSARFWYQHFQAVEPEGEGFSDITRRIDMFFSSHNSRAYVNWLRLHNCDALVPIDCDYALNLEAVPEPLYYASLLGFHTTVAKLVEAGANMMTRGRLYRSPLVAASVHGFPETVDQLLKAMTKIETADACQIVAKISGKNIAKTMSALLERPGLFPVTEEVVNAVIKNERSGPEALGILMEYKGAEVSITEEMVKTAAENWGCGRRLMNMLLDRHGTIPITEEVLIAAVENELCGKEVISTLIDRCSPHMTITEALVESAANNKRNRDVISFLLGRAGAEPEITEGGMMKIIRRFDKGIILTLLGRSMFKLPITHRVMLDMARMSPKSVIMFLYSRHGIALEITKKIEREILRRFDEEFLNILLNQLKADASITEAILKAVVGNDTGDVLLTQQRQGSQITPEILNLACRNWRSGEEILRALLRYQKTGILLSKDLVIAAAENSRSGSRLMIALISHQRVDMRLEEEVVTEIVQRLDNEVIEVLFKRQPDIELTEAILVAAACNVKYEGNLIEFLLKAQDSKPPITEAVIRAAINNRKQGVKLLAWLLQQTISPTASGVIGDIVSHNGCPSDVMTLLLSQPIHKVVLCDIIEEILERRDDNFITHSPEVPIAETIAKAAAANKERWYKGLSMLLEEDTVPITEDAVEAAMRNTGAGFETNEALVNERVIIPFTKEIFRVAEKDFESGSRIIKRLLDRQHDVHISELLKESFPEKVGLDQGSDTLEERNTETPTIAAIGDQSSDEYEGFGSFPPDRIILSQDEAKELLEDEDSSAETLSLQQNQIDHNSFRKIPSTIKSLDLSDNLISRIQDTDSFMKLRYLNVESNKIRQIEGLTHMTQLTDLYLSRNKISRIQNLDTLGHLRHLDLSGNRIRSLESLDNLHLLQELYLDKNKITEIKKIDSLINLRILSLQSNRLTTMSGLSQLLHLEELYLGYNQIAKISGLESCLNLRVLDIRGNNVSCLENLAHLQHLEELWASNNRLSSVEEVEIQLGDKKHLKSIEFKGNPLGTAGSKKLWLALPHILFIDSATRPVGP
ncbi:NACHT domain-containing protein [Penicillium sp. IBT 16267x]|nr:NACHT domain-containing protein [Penicillium sp. IBT 16267x]